VTPRRPSAAPRPAPGGPASHPLRALAACCLLALAACRGDADGGAATVRLLDHAAAGRYLRTAASDEPRVLFRGADAPLDAWHPIARLGAAAADDDAGAEQEQRFWETARAEAGGVLSLADVRGGWMTVVELDRDRPLLLEASAHVRGLEPGTGARGVRLGLMEFDAVPASTDREELERLRGAMTWGETFLGRDRRHAASLLVRPRPETRAVGLFFFLTLNPPVPGAAVTWSDVSLREAGPLDYALVAVEDANPDFGYDAIPTGSFTIALTRRPSLLVLPGDAASIPVRLPRGASAFDAAVGLVPGELVSLGERARFRCRLVPEGGTARDAVELAAVEVEGAGIEHARWTPLRAEVPAALEGARVRVELAVEADRDAPLVPVFAHPRFVPAAPRRPGPNLVLLSLDTLRADRVGCYGSTRETTPAIDALAARSLVYEEAWSTAPYTLPAHASMLSGQFPSVHGAERPGSRLDAGRTRMLAEILHDAGYLTAAFTGGGFVDPLFGFGRGFDRYGVLDPIPNVESEKLLRRVDELPDRNRAMVAENSIDAVVDWVTEHAAEPFFLFVHTYTPHQFNPPDRHLDALDAARVDLKSELDLASLERLFDHAAPSPAERARLLEVYDATIRFADEGVGSLLDGLERLGLSERTVVVVTSDHGKEFGEHGAVNHGHSLHTELLRVPLIVQVPGLAPARIERPVMLVDLVPTLLDALDLPLPADAPPIQGRSQLPGARPDLGRALFAEVDSGWTKVALRRDAIKTIVTRRERGIELDRLREESYDVTRDPLEREPLEDDPERVDAAMGFRAALRELGASLSSGEVAREELDRAARQRLEELGYTLGADD